MHACNLGCAFGLQVVKASQHAKVSSLLEVIRGNCHTLRLVLQPFSPKQTQEFLAAALCGVVVSAEVAHKLWEKTGGLPLYIEQVDISTNGADK